MPRLTMKQETFAAAMANGASASAAYREVYDARKMAATTVHKRASELAKNGGVAGRIAELRAPAVVAVEETTSVDLQRLLFEDARIALSDVGQLYDEEGNLIPVHKLPEDVRRSIASVEVVQLYGEGRDGKGAIGHTKKLKLWDKGAAIDRLRRALGGYEKDNRQKADALAGVPREILKRIEGRLLELAKQPSLD